MGHATLVNLVHAFEHLVKDGLDDLVARGQGIGFTGDGVRVVRSHADPLIHIHAGRVLEQEKEMAGRLKHVEEVDDVAVLW